MVAFVVSRPGYAMRYYLALGIHESMDEMNETVHMVARAFEKRKDCGATGEFGLVAL